jgi:very-short-patch-repair endonuclease
MKRFVSRVRSLRRAATSAEDLLWQELRNRQLGRWEFRRQHPIDRFIVDFVTLDGKLIVEVDGATHSEPEELRGDAERTRILESLGFHVVRITNEDVYSNMGGVLNTILHELGSI